MKRDLIRMFQRQGVKPLLMPLVVVSLMLFVFYQYVDDYVEHRDEAAELGLRLEVMDTTFELSKAVEAMNTSLKTEYASIPSRAYRSEKVDESLEAMKNNVTEVLQSLYFDSIEISKASPPSNARAARIAVNAQFSGVPQQLPRLEEMLASYSKALRMGDVHISVVDDASGASPHLDIKARLSGMHVAPDAVEKPKPLAIPR